MTNVCRKSILGDAFKMKNLWLFWLLVCTGILDAWGVGQNAPLFTDCGVRQEIPGEVKTRAPWTAAIYIRPLDSDSPRFFTTGTIIGPTTVLTMARGAFGGSFKGASPNLLPPGSFFVVAGMSTTELSDGDEYVQRSEVFFLEPDTSSNVEDEEKDYHFMVFHLKTILNFETPFVKALCLLPPRWDQHKKIIPFGHRLSTSGFTISSMKDAKTAILRTDEILTLSKGECTSSFSYYYKRELNEEYTYCGVKSQAYESKNYTSIGVVQAEWDSTSFRIGTNLGRSGFEEEESNNYCFLHGAINTAMADGKWYLSGMLSLIPGKRRGICNDGNLYFFERSNKYLAWLHQSVHCSPNKFSCGDAASTCLPLSNVCNGESNCPGTGRDEHQLFCEVSNQCNGNSTNSEMFSCGLNGKCINKSQVCDGTLDCREGNDESPEHCAKLLAAPGNSTLANKCPKFKISKGISCSSKLDEKLGNCLDAVEPGTELYLSCAPYHASNYGYSSINVSCDGASGEWRKKKPFSCTAECGIVQTVKDRNLPWNGIMGLRDSQAGQYCSAVLIEESFILTAASCLKGRTAEMVVTALEPTSLDIERSWFTEGHTQLVQIKEFWIPKWFNGDSVDLALAKIDRVGTNEQGQGTPVCYLNSAKIFKKLSRTNTTGKVVHIKKELDGSGTLKEKIILNSDFNLSPRVDCIKYPLFANLPSYMFCGSALGESLLPTDIGAGLYIWAKNPVTGSMQMHLKGIVVSPNVTMDSNYAEFAQVFVNTDYFINWITDVMSKNYLLD